jgi:hypothetical protein
MRARCTIDTGRHRPFGAEVEAMRDGRVRIFPPLCKISTAPSSSSRPWRRSQRLRALWPTVQMCFSASEVKATRRTTNAVRARSAVNSGCLISPATDRLVLEAVGLGDDLFHDLVGTGADTREPRVAPRALDGKLAHVAVASEDLDRVVRDLARDLGREQLRL